MPTTRKENDISIFSKSIVLKAGSIVNCGITKLEIIKPIDKITSKITSMIFKIFGVFFIIHNFGFHFINHVIGQFQIEMFYPDCAGREQPVVCRVKTDGQVRVWHGNPARFNGVV